MLKRARHFVRIVFLEIKYRHLLYGSLVRVKKGGKLNLSRNVRIINSIITIGEGSEFYLEDNSRIKNAKIFLRGTMRMGKSNIIEGISYSHPVLIRINGLLDVGNFNRIRASIWIRFDGRIYIGNYNCINEGTEIRSDERVSIGDFNQISYNCDIWDTNTHNLYPYHFRRQLTINKFPLFGFEINKPKTSPIMIGNDCWVGKNVAILKGTNINDKAVIGYGVVISNNIVPPGKTVVSKGNLVLIDNKLNEPTSANE